MDTLSGEENLPFSVFFPSQWASENVFWKSFVVAEKKTCISGRCCSHMPCHRNALIYLIHSLINSFIHSLRQTCRRFRIRYQNTLHAVFLVYFQVKGTSKSRFSPSWVESLSGGFHPSENNPEVRKFVPLFDVAEKHVAVPIYLSEEKKIEEKNLGIILRNVRYETTRRHDEMSDLRGI